jgi:hypothetical protein
LRQYPRQINEPHLSFSRAEYGQRIQTDGSHHEKIMAKMHVRHDSTISRAVYIHPQAAPDLSEDLEKALKSPPQAAKVTDATEIIKASFIRTLDSTSSADEQEGGHDRAKIKSC